MIPNNNDYRYLEPRVDVELARSFRGRAYRILGIKKKRITDPGHWPPIYQCGDRFLCEINRYLSDFRIEWVKSHRGKIRIVVAVLGLAGLGVTASDPVVKLYGLIGAVAFIVAVMASFILWLPKRGENLLKRILGKITVVVFYDYSVLLLPNGFGYSWFPLPKPLKLPVGQKTEVTLDGVESNSDKKRGWLQRFFDAPGGSDASEDIHEKVHKINIQVGLASRSIVVYDTKDAAAITNTLKAADHLREYLAGEMITGAPEQERYVG